MRSDVAFVCLAVLAGSCCATEEIPVAVPPYLFHMSNRCGDSGKSTGTLPEMPNDMYFAREYVQTVYPESFMDTGHPVDFTVNGRRSWNIHPADKIARSRIIERREMSFRLDAEGYEPKTVTVPLLMVSVEKTAGLPVRLLMIGDSTMASMWGNEHGRYEDGSWGLVSAVQELAVKDAVDAQVPCRFVTIGTESRDDVTKATCKVAYRGKTYRLRHFSEARSGTGLHYLTMTPIPIAPRNLVTDIGDKNVHALLGVAAWDALGLGSRLPIDRPRDEGAEYVPCPVDENGRLTEDAHYLVRTTPFGKYHWNYTENLWKNVANLLRRTDRWTGSADQKAIVDDFFARKMDRPDSPFYDKVRAREGDWAFSVEKYLERCRTLTDDGDRLYFGPRGETVGVGGSLGYLKDGTKTSYRIGTWVSDVMQWDVCLPTHVVLEYGGNDWVHYAGEMERVMPRMAVDHEKVIRRIIAAFSAAAPSVRVGLFSSRTAGPAFPWRWNDVAVAGCGRPQRDQSEPYRRLMRSWYRREFADLGAMTSYIPVDAVVPVATAWSAAALPVPSTGREVNVIYGQDLIHDGLCSQRCKALQIYGWIRYTSVAAAR